MIDVVIPLGTGSKHSNIELRYTLRGIENHLRGIGCIYIVGHCPGWLKNIIHLPIKEFDSGAKFKEHNIFMKVLHACKFIKGEFLFMNDDHFLIRDFNGYAEFWPPLCEGTVLELNYNRTQDDPYWNTVFNTAMVVGGAAKNFDVHCPMRMFGECVENLAEEFPLEVWEKYGYLFKSLYAKTERIGGYPCIDLKFREPLKKIDILAAIQNKAWFSLDERAMNADMMEILSELYPVKSSYEV